MSVVERVWRWVVGGVIVASLAATAWVIVSHPHRVSVLPSLTVDAVTYDAIGLDLANRRTLDAIPLLQPPGFVTFLALVFTVCGHSWVAAKMALWLALAAITLLAGRLASRIYASEAAGWMAALLCATAPALGWYATTIQYELVAALLTLALVTRATTPQTEQRPVSLAAAMATGVLAGAAVLTREVLIVLVPIVALTLAWRVRAMQGTRAALRVGGAVVVVAAVVVASWSVLQSARAGRVIGITDKGPAVLQYGNNPLANGTFNASQVGVAEPSGVAFMRAQPIAASRLAVRKALYFWGVLRDGWNVPRPAALWLSRATFGALPLAWTLPLARGGWILIGVIAALALWPRGRWRDWWIVPAAIAGVMLVHVITLASHRFAVPILPLALAIVAGPLAWMARGVWSRPALRVAAGLVLVAGLGAQCLPPRLSYHLRAVDVDGDGAPPMLDAAIGEIVRDAPIAPGPRTVTLVTDEFLPAGAWDIGVGLRGLTAVTDDAIAARVRVFLPDGTQPCARTVTSLQLSADYRTIVLPCTLASSGPVTLSVETLAVLPLRVRDVRLETRRE